MQNLFSELRKRYRYYKPLVGSNVVESHAVSHTKKFHSVKAILESYLGELKNKRILDIGCGYNAPQSVMFAAYGCRVVALDSCYLSFRNSKFERVLKTIRYNGPVQAAKAFYVLYRTTDHFYDVLEQESALPVKQSLQSARLSTKRGTITKLPFDGESFDAVISNAVLEHISNLPKVVEEIYRVLKGEGVTYHEIHLYSSPSGGHHPLWYREDFNHWDHLRRRKEYVPTDLNGLRWKNYIAAFSEKFEIMEAKAAGTEEGRKWLTPQIKKELSAYDDFDLTTRALLLTAKKTAQSAVTDFNIIA